MTEMNNPGNINFDDLSEEGKQIQCSIWAMLFLLGEMAAGLHALRTSMVEKGALTEEDCGAMDGFLRNPQNIQQMYHQIEKAFQEKYHRTRFALENPEQVEEFVRGKMEGRDVVDPSLPGGVDGS